MRFILPFVFVLYGHSAFADSIFSSLGVDATQLNLTRKGKATSKQEVEKIAIEAAKEVVEEALKRLLSVGQTDLNGSSPTYVFSGGTALTADLTFGWIDPSTGLTTTGPAVASVDYYVWNGPGVNLDLLSPTWSLVGTSSNASSGFLFSYSFPFGEKIFLSAPLDSSGKQIVINGVDGYNDAESLVVAITTPEPASCIMLGTGLLALAAATRRRLVRA